MKLNPPGWLIRTTNENGRGKQHRHHPDLAEQHGAADRRAGAAASPGSGQARAGWSRDAPRPARAPSPNAHVPSPARPDGDEQHDRCRREERLIRIGRSGSASAHCLSPTTIATNAPALERLLPSSSIEVAPPTQWADRCDQGRLILHLGDRRPCVPGFPSSPPVPAAGSSRSAARADREQLPIAADAGIVRALRPCAPSSRSAGVTWNSRSSLGTRNCSLRAAAHADHDLVAVALVGQRSLP